MVSLFCCNVVYLCCIFILSLCILFSCLFFFQAEDGIRVAHYGLEFRRVLFRSPLKTDATLVRGCSASVWVYPTVRDDGALHFMADSNAAITKGIIALVLLTVQDRGPADILATDIEGALAPFDLKDRKSVVEGKRVFVRLDPGGRRIINKKQ